MIETLGIISSIVMPFFNIPLIVRMRQRKSSKDISLAWTAGVMACTLAMFPAGVMSDSVPFKCFSLVNLALFSAVAYHVIKFRN